MAGDEKKKVTGLQRLAGKLAVPASSIANVTHMELEGNSQVRIENSGGILQYSNEEIRIKTGKLTARFVGRSLEIKCLSCDLLEIHGCIQALYFEM